MNLIAYALMISETLAQEDLPEERVAVFCSIVSVMAQKYKDKGYTLEPTPEMLEKMKA